MYYALILWFLLPWMTTFLNELSVMWLASQLEEKDEISDSKQNHK